MKYCTLFIIEGTVASRAAAAIFVGPWIAGGGKVCTVDAQEMARMYADAGVNEFPCLYDGRGNSYEGLDKIAAFMQQKEDKEAELVYELGFGEDAPMRVRPKEQPAELSPSALSRIQLERGYGKSSATDAEAPHVPCDCGGPGCPDDAPPDPWISPRKGYFLCPVRGQGPAEMVAQLAYVEELEAKGWKIHWPPRDTQQDDPSGGWNICNQNMQAIKAAERVFIYWDGKSYGSHFDLGIAFAFRKPITVVWQTPGAQTYKKSFRKLLQVWSLLFGETPDWQS